MEQKIRHIFFGFMIIAFQSGVEKSHPEQDTCHWQSVWYEILLLFNISLREIYSESVSLRVMKKYDESTLPADFASVSDTSKHPLTVNMLKAPNKTLVKSG